MISHHDKREQYYSERVRICRQQYPDCPASSLEVVLKLLYAYDTLHGRLSQRLSQYNLSTAAFNVLMIVRRYGVDGCPLHEIGELLLVSRANVTGVVDSLETNGLVQRVTHPNDRRVRLARVTPAGNALLDKYLPQHYTYIGQELSGLSEEEKVELSRLLSKLYNSIQSQPNA